VRAPNRDNARGQRSVPLFPKISVIRESRRPRAAAPIRQVASHAVPRQEREDEQNDQLQHRSTLPNNGNVETGKTSHDDELLPQGRTHKIGDHEDKNIRGKDELGETTMEILVSIPAVFGTMAVMVAFFMIVTR
jgi:hypothetical protein